MATVCYLKMASPWFFSHFRRQASHRNLSSIGGGVILQSLFVKSHRFWVTSALASLSLHLCTGVFEKVAAFWSQTIFLSLYIVAWCGCICLDLPVGQIQNQTKRNHYENSAPCRGNSIFWAPFLADDAMLTQHDLKIISTSVNIWEQVWTVRVWG